METQHNFRDQFKCQGGVLTLQILIIVPSILFYCTYPMWQIYSRKLLNNPFAFLIFLAQLCFLIIGIIDLTSKIPSQNQSKLWCQILNPIVYAFIFVIIQVMKMTFIFIELFCYMLYRTIVKQNGGYLYNNIKKVCGFITLFSIAINYISFPFYQMGVCNNCTINKKGNSKYQKLAIVITYFDYFAPFILVIPIIVGYYRLQQRYKNNPIQSRLLKIFTIPFMNMILLGINNFVSSPGLAQTLQKLPNMIYILLYQTLYFVPLVNLFFYNRFAKAFQIQDHQNENRIFCQCCYKNKQQNEEDILFTYAIQQGNRSCEFRY